MDILHSITNWIDQNRYTFIGLVIGLCLAAAVFFGVPGCQSRTIGIVPEQGKVTRVELEQQRVEAIKDLDILKQDAELAIERYNIELAAVNEKITAANADLDQQDQLKADVVNSLAVIATDVAGGAAFNPVGLIPILSTLILGGLGIGLKADNNRKDAVITAKSSPTSYTTAT